jgi:uncharacterized RDD family membrane protein YckC
LYCPRCGAPNPDGVAESMLPQPAGIFRRIGAFGLDVLLVWALGTWLVAAGEYFYPVWTNQTLDRIANYVGLVWIGAFGLYCLLTWGLLGRSPGKWITGLYLSGPSGRPLGGFSGVVRSGLRYAFMALLAWFAGIAWWSALVRRDRRAAHDLAADTTLVEVQPHDEHHRREAAAGRRFAAALLVLAAVVAAALIAVPFSASAQRTSGPRPAAATSPTERAVRAAINEFDALSVEAEIHWDPAILRPRATEAFVAKTANDMHTAKMQAQATGVTSIRLALHGIEYVNFRTKSSTRAEVDVNEVWSSESMDAAGNVISAGTQHDVPQTYVFVLEDGAWKVDDIHFYSNSQPAPFAFKSLDTAAQVS